MAKLAHHIDHFKLFKLNNKTPCNVRTIIVIYLILAYSIQSNNQNKFTQCYVSQAKQRHYNLQQVINIKYFKDSFHLDIRKVATTYHVQQISVSLFTHNTMTHRL